MGARLELQNLKCRAVCGTVCIHAQAEVLSSLLVWRVEKYSSCPLAGFASQHFGVLQVELFLFRFRVDTQKQTKL